MNISKRQTSSVLQSWSKQGKLNPIPVKDAEGIYIWDFNGNRYTDMSSQLVNLNAGHKCKPIIEAIKKQAENYCYISPSYASEPRAELAEMLLSKAPDNMGKVFFTNGGADANENAVKMAKQFTGRSKVFSRYRSYHGSTFGAGNLTGEPRRYPLEPGIPGFVKFFDPYIYRSGLPFQTEEEYTKYFIDRLKEQIIYENPSEVAAIILETVTGSNGVIIPPVGYLKKVRDICDEFGILMICDEVMTGFYRTGKFFGFENFDVIPDMITFAKGVNSGYVPLGGVIVSKQIAAHFDDNLLSCGLTYSGHPLGCAAGIACLKFYEEENIGENVQKSGAVLKNCLETIAKKHKNIGEIRSIGLFSAVEFVKDKDTREALVPYGKDPENLMGKIIGALAKKGFMTYSHENMVLICPPLIITEEQVGEELTKFDETITELGY
jgi:taurine--2-oxoglutarate transaminase